MNILILFLIGIILYLCYKIFTFNELFQYKIDISDKKILLKRNLAINMNQNKLEELNKLDIDLSKNNLIIDNKYNNKISIKKDLCIGNFCINKEKLNLIGGKIDAPQFYKTNSNGTTDSEVYYNHDCNLNNKNNKYCGINSVKDLPDKLCFNYIDENTSNQEKLCIGPNEFDILKGKRGIKLKNIDSNKDTIPTLGDTKYQELEKSYTNPKYVMPYYADFRETGMDIESTKDQLLFKNNHECTKSKALYTENPKFNPRKYPYYKDKKSEINCNNVDCNDSLQSRQCLHKCSEQIISRENKSLSDNKLFNIPEFTKEEKKVAEDQGIYLKPKIIDDDGWIKDNNWLRICKEDLATNSVFNKNKKKIYCLKHKSKDIEKPYDAPKVNTDPRRQGDRSYSCDNRPNWMMEPGRILENNEKAMGDDPINLKKKLSTINEAHSPDSPLYNYPYHLLYGTTWDNHKEKDKSNKKGPLEEVYMDYPPNNEIYNEIIKSYRNDLNVPIGDRNPVSLDNTDQLKRGVLFHNYKKGTGRTNFSGWCCNSRYGWGTDNREVYDSTKNKVNDCIADYNYIKEIGDKGELSNNNNHGWYILPESFPIDPNYNGYYIDENNNNVRYLLKDNAISKASKFLGNIDNHRVSHDGVCGKNENTYPNLKYFCNGPNSFNPLYNKVCNPITEQHTKILNCMNKKLEIDVETEPEMEVKVVPGSPSWWKQRRKDREKAQTKGSWPTRPPDNEPDWLGTAFDNHLETCTQENNGDSIIKDNPNGENIDEQFKKLNELDELNYFIQPSRDNSDNIIKSNTYFHAHEHVHDK